MCQCVCLQLSVQLCSAQPLTEFSTHQWLILLFPSSHSSLAPFLSRRSWSKVHFLSSQQSTWTKRDKLQYIITPNSEGRHLCDSLMQRGSEARVKTNLLNNPKSKLKGIPHVWSSVPSSIFRAPRRSAAVFHSSWSSWMFSTCTKRQRFAFSLCVITPCDKFALLSVWMHFSVAT